MCGYHGGLDEHFLKKAGIDPDEFKVFSVSINPAAMPNDIQAVIQKSAISRYPVSHSRALVRAIFKQYGLGGEEILVVNGTSQAIYLIAGALLEKDSLSMVAGPAYSEYADATEAVGGQGGGMPGQGRK